jgi:hypothetical protein
MTEVDAGCRIVDGDARGPAAHRSCIPVRVIHAASPPGVRLRPALLRRPPCSSRRPPRRLRAQRRLHARDTASSALGAPSACCVAGQRAAAVHGCR